MTFYVYAFWFLAGFVSACFCGWAFVTIKDWMTRQALEKATQALQQFQMAVEQERAKRSGDPGLN